MVQSVCLISAILSSELERPTIYSNSFLKYFPNINNGIILLEIIFNVLQNFLFIYSIVLLFSLVISLKQLSNIIAKIEVEIDAQKRKENLSPPQKPQA